MGLGGRKEKQKLRDDPRNRQWADDTNKFGFKMLSKQGWNPQVGLGSYKQGNVNAIKSSYKFDTMGIGADLKKKDDWSGGVEFGNILAKLNKQQQPQVQEPQQSQQPPQSNTTSTTSTSKNISRKKYRNAKSQLNDDAMREILGVDSSGSVPSSKSSTPVSTDSEIPTMKNKSNLSIGEYFRIRLLLKYQQNQQSSFNSPTIPSTTQNSSDVTNFESTTLETTPETTPMESDSTRKRKRDHSQPKSQPKSQSKSKSKSTSKSKSSDHWKDLL